MCSDHVQNDGRGQTWVWTQRRWTVWWRAKARDLRVTRWIASFHYQGSCSLRPQQKPLTVWITINCGKFLRTWEYQTTLPASWAICVQVKKQQLQLSMGQQTGSKLRKEYVKAVYCHPAYFNITRVHHRKCWAGWITSWNQGCWEKYRQPQKCRWYLSNGIKQRRS